LASLLAIPAIVLLITALGLTHWRLTWFSPGFLKGIPIRHKIYDRLPVMVLDGILEEAALSSNDPELVEKIEGALGREALEDFAAAFIPPEWLQGQVDGNIEAFFDFLDGETPYPYLQITFSDLRENATGGVVRGALRNLLAPLPPCERDQSFYLSDVPQCRPSDAALDEILDDAALSLREMFPVDLSFQEIIEDDPGYPDQTTRYLENIRLGYRVFKIGVWGSWLAYLLLLGFIVLISAESFDKALLWAGWPTLVGSLISAVRFIVGLITIPLLGKYWTLQLPPDVPSGLVADFFSILSACNVDIQSVGLLFSGGLVVFSAVLITSSYLLHRFREEPLDDLPASWR
jgi:hypothetical protein